MNKKIFNKLKSSFCNVLEFSMIILLLTREIKNKYRFVKIIKVLKL